MIVSGKKQLCGKVYGNMVAENALYFVICLSCFIMIAHFSKKVYTIISFNITTEARLEPSQTSTI